MSEIKNIHCPNCQHEFDVEEALAGKLEASYKEKISKVSEELKQQFAEKEANLQEQQKDFEAKKKKENELFKERLSSEKERIEAEIKKNTKEEFTQQTNSLKKELEEKRQQVMTLKDKELEIERIKNQMAEQEKDIALKYEKQKREEMRLIEENITKRIEQQQALKLVEKDQQLDAQNKLIEELKRKKDQGSMQTQGEVQEIAIEEILRAKFPFDIIEEVPKGVRGADSVQTVINQAQQVCGKILYESKRTKAFSNDWLDKLKADQRNIGAEIAVLITETMPKELDQFGQIQGVWICQFHEFAAVVAALRTILVKSQSVASVQENKGDKMEVLYRFVTSDEFKHQITAIVEGFSNMKLELDREKRAMQRLWKTREKQIDMVIENTINMHSSIKGIAGNAIPKIQILELDDGMEDEGEH